MNAKNAKKKETINYKELEKKHPVIRHSIEFLSDVHQAFDGGSVPLLHEFINKYTESEYEPFVKYAKGLKMTWLPWKMRFSIVISVMDPLKVSTTRSNYSDASATEDHKQSF